MTTPADKERDCPTCGAGTVVHEGSGPSRSSIPKRDCPECNWWLYIGGGSAA